MPKKTKKVHPAKEQAYSAPASPVPELSPEERTLRAREALLDKLRGKEQWQAHDRGEWNRAMHSHHTTEVVDNALKEKAKDARAAHEAKLERRRVKRFNSQITMRLVVMTARGEQHVLMETEDSVYLNKLHPMIQERLGTKDRLRLLWLNEGGEVCTARGTANIERLLHAASRARARGRS